MPKFYNMYQSNDTASVQPLRLHTDLIQPLLLKPSEWDVSIVRFVLPGYNLPIFTFRDNTYFLFMSYNGSTESQAVVWNDAILNQPDHNIYEVQTYVLLLNETLVSIWNALKITEPSLPGSNTDTYFTYNEVTCLMSLTTDVRYYLYTLPNPIVIGGNESLLTKLEGFPINAVNNNLYNFLVANLHTNVVGNAVTMTQQASNFDNMVDLDGILIQTNLPTQNEVQGRNISLPILTDYVPADLTISVFHNRIIYNPQGPPFRQVSLLSDSPFMCIDVMVYITNTMGVLTPLQIGPGQSANLKFMFTRKDQNKYA